MLLNIPIPFIWSLPTPQNQALRVLSTLGIGLLVFGLLVYLIYLIFVVGETQFISGSNRKRAKRHLFIKIGVVSLAICIGGFAGVINWMGYKPTTDHIVAVYTSKQTTLSDHRVELNFSTATQVKFSIITDDDTANDFVPGQSYQMQINYYRLNGWLKPNKRNPLSKDVMIAGTWPDNRPFIPNDDLTRVMASLSNQKAVMTGKFHDSLPGATKPTRTGNTLD